MKIDVYDFDGTIYDGDSSIDFFLFCLKRNKKIIIKIIPIMWYILLYFLKKKDKTKSKEKIFSFLNYVDDINKTVNEFWISHKHKIKKFYLDKNHNNDIIISASPEFLLKPICEKLKVKLLIGSIVSKKTGKFTGLNCHDHEKVKRLKAIYKEFTIENMYTDSYSDQPLIDLSKHAYIVKKNKLIKIK